MDAFQILVIILSGVLFVSLVLGIVLIALLIKIVRQIQRVTDTVEKTVDSAKNTVNNIKKFVTPAIFQGLIEKLIGFINNKKEEHKNGKKG